VISQKQLDANRRNALKSTGPKTPQGKAAVLDDPRPNSRAGPPSLKPTPLDPGVSIAFLSRRLTSNALSIARSTSFKACQPRPPGPP
jgi:hypothetical protein